MFLCPIACMATTFKYDKWYENIYNCVQSVIVV